MKKLCLFILCFYSCFVSYSFAMREIADQTLTSSLQPEEFNDLKNESQNLITTSSITLTAGDLNQLGKAVATYVGDADYYIDSGIASSYVLTSTNSRESAQYYSTGMRARFRPLFTSTGTAYVNINSIGVKSIKLADGLTDVPTGAISSSYDTGLVYDGTNFRISGIELPFLFVGVGTTTTSAILNISSTSTTANDMLKVSTGTTGLFIVKGDGNVGIATTTPQSKLDVNGTISLESTATLTYDPTNFELDVSTPINAPEYRLTESATKYYVLSVEDFSPITNISLANFRFGVSTGVYVTVDSSTTGVLFVKGLSLPSNEIITNIEVAYKDTGGNVSFSIAKYKIIGGYFEHTTLLQKIPSDFPTTAGGDQWGQVNFTDISETQTDNTYRYTVKLSIDNDTAYLDTAFAYIRFTTITNNIL